MNTLGSILAQVTITELIAISISILAFFLSVLSYVSNTEEFVRRRELKKAVRLLFARSRLYWDTYVSAYQIHYSPELREMTDPAYLFEGLIESSKPLLQAIDNAMCHGFLKYLIKEDDDWKYLIGFTSSLQEISNEDAKKKINDNAWFQTIFVKGFKYIFLAIFNYDGRIISRNEKVNLIKQIELIYMKA